MRKQWVSTIEPPALTRQCGLAGINRSTVDASHLAAKPDSSKSRDNKTQAARQRGRIALRLTCTSQTHRQQGGNMNKLIENFANAAALLGVLLTIGSGLARLLDMYHLGSFQTMTVFNGGMGLMLIGIVGKLHTLKRAP
ncbi:MAG: hypothetical protein ACLQHK_02660 [Gallionellaceae bacterium]